MGSAVILPELHVLQSVSAMGLELEKKMLDWFARMMKLPDYFRHDYIPSNSDGQKGGGIIYVCQLCFKIL